MRWGSLFKGGREFILLTLFLKSNFLSLFQLKDFVEFRKEDYEKKNIGTDKLALSTLKTILDVQSPSEKDVEKIIGSKKVKSIRGQILDILGALQSWEAYSGAMTALMDKEDAVDDLERYLQTLAVGKKPERKIIEGAKSII